MSASVAPAARIQGSLNIIPDLVDYLVQSYEDKYDKAQAIIERQDMAVSNEAVQERFKRLHDQIQELEGFLPSDSALNGAVIFNHALSAHPEDLRTLSPQQGIDDFTMTLARLKATSLSHVNLISFDMRDRPWRVNADLKYLRDNEGRRSYFAEYNNRLVLVSEKNIPSGSISRDTSLQRLAWQLKISEDIKELRILPFLGYSYEYPLSSGHTRHKVLYSIHGKDAISLRDMLRTKNIDHFRSLLSHTMRFELAQSLAQSILYLHTAGWLHRGIRSSHIIFCSEREFFSDTHEQLEQLEQLDLPYLAGFDYTYLPPYDAGDEKLQVHIKERQLYRHPDVQHDPTTTYDAAIGDNDPSFTKNHDIYSFGVILVELGLLRSALRIWSERSREKCNGSRKFQSYLISELIPQVRSEMGSIYADVALYCLRSNSYVSGELDCVGAVAFYKNVIAQLERGKKSLCSSA
jgi:hypothetical protein